MEMWERSFRLETSRSDLNGIWKLSAFFEITQETANEHCRALRVGRDDLAEKDLTWVLFKTDIAVERYPRLGETVTVETFTRKRFMHFLPRYYIVKDAEGNAVAKAGSLWVLMDRTTRKSVSPETYGIAIPVSDKEAPVRLFTQQPKRSGEGTVREVRPQYSDIDFNGHVNNIRYIDWLCNDLGIERMREMEISTLSVSYSHEVLPEDALRNKLVIEGENFQYSGDCGEKPMFYMTGTLRKKGK